jgi:hypothetical protein
VLKQVISFSNVENLFFKFFENVSFKVKLLGRELFEFLRTSTFKFEKVCERKFLDSLKIGGVWREVFELLKVSSFKGVKDFFQNFQSFERLFVVYFVFKMLFFQMESLKVMEKFDGGNFHLWKFKMRMMFFKHGLWKFIDVSATLPSEEVASANYNEKEMKAFALLCEHFMDAQFAHIHYCDNVRSAWEVLCGVHEIKTMVTSYSFEGDSSPSKCKKEMTCLCISTQ